MGPLHVSWLGRGRKPEPLHQRGGVWVSPPPSGTIHYAPQQHNARTQDLAEKTSVAPNKRGSCPRTTERAGRAPRAEALGGTRLDTRLQRGCRLLGERERDRA